MTLWLAIIGAVLQIVLLSMKQLFESKAEVKQAHADKKKEISDAIASGDLSRINTVIGSLRR